MVIATIRNHLSVVCALAAALSLGAFVIGQLRYDNLKANMEIVINNNTKLTNSNKQNVEQIQELINQRLIDDRLMQKLDDQFKILAIENAEVRKSFKELKNNDNEFKELLTKRHPPTLNELLNERKRNRSSDGSEANKTSDEIPSGL